MTNFTPGNDGAWGMMLQPDEKIVAAGFAADGMRFALSRYNTNGTLDSSFGGDGRVTTYFTSGFDWALEVALQADGKIVAAGRAAGFGEGFALARYNTNGSLDSTFSGDGRVITNFNTGSDVATGVGVESDGNIVAVGWSGPARSNDYRFAVARYTTNGSLDASFSGDGKALPTSQPAMTTRGGWRFKRTTGSWR